MAPRRRSTRPDAMSTAPTASLNSNVDRDGATYVTHVGDATRSPSTTAR